MWAEDMPRNKCFFFRFEYHMFYVLYPFVTYLLTLPSIIKAFWLITNTITISLWRCCIKTTVVFLDIIHCPLFYLKHKLPEIELCLCLLVEPTQLGPINRAGPYLWTPETTQHKPSARVKTDIKIIQKIPHTRPSTCVHALFHGYWC
jgi:hypothetical protein